MNCHVLPKNKLDIIIDINEKSEKITQILSHSLNFYLIDVQNQIFKNNNFDVINKIINPNDFIFTNVIGTDFYVSKTTPKSNIFFDLIEVFQCCNIDELYLKNKIEICVLTPNYSSVNDFLNVIRESNNDKVMYTDFNYNKIVDTFITNNFQNKFDLFIFELKREDYKQPKTYLQNMIVVLTLIIKYQTFQGISIIKIDNLFYQIMIDILYIFSSLFDKIIIMKPLTSNVITSERYIICKGFNVEHLKQACIDMECKLTNLLLDPSISIENVHSIISNEIPYYFVNKIEECNLMIGEQQLESYDQLINIFNNKNKDEKIDNLKRNHIQKCVQWCEKNKILHNKFMDKTNIFLNSKKKEVDY